jgi:hypothetical protein
MSAPPKQPKIYHITHLSNLESIISTGYIYSDAVMIGEGTETTGIGMSTIKKRRLTLSDCTLASSGDDYRAADSLPSASKLRSLTSEVLRSTERTVFVPMRTMFPNWLMSIISVVSSTKWMAEALPISLVVFMKMTPLPTTGVSSNSRSRRSVTPHR